MTRLRPAFALVAAVAAAAVLAGCGGSGKTSAASTSTPTQASSNGAASPTATAPADPAAAKAQIVANWQTFFDYRTPRAQAQALLEDGASLGGALAMAAAEQKQTHLKQRTKVTLVTFLSPTEARVSYQLLNGTQVLLNDASGTATLVGGTWKVSKVTLCTLVQLGAGGKAVPGC